MTDPASDQHTGHPHSQAGSRYALRLVFWESTAGCNLQCRHCRRLDVSLELSKSDLTTEQAKRMIAAVREVGEPIFVFSGGEPLIRPDIYELAQFAHEKGLPTALATNGTLIDAAVAAKIRDAHIRRVSVSLDGADEETHDYLRCQPGCFAAACAGLNHLRAAGVSTQINCTVARHNVDQLDRVYQLALDLGVEALHLFMLVPVGCGADLPATDMLSADRYEQVLNWLYDRSREEKLFVKATCAPHYYRIARQRSRADGRPLNVSTHGMSAMTRGCLAGTSVCFISHTGDVFPCGYLPVSCGNVNELPFMTIWNDSSVFARLRDTGQLGGKCGVCEYSKVCSGCRARAHFAGGDYMGEEPYCAYVPMKLKEGV
ncbi:MAG: radical SAM protein [Phycisphaerae bacterium]|nr:radical SAM protein [Phycisphaerae bacterium]